LQIEINQMMPAQTDNPEYWRFRAEEVRTIAEQMKHTEPKPIMAKIADDCERIAKLFEEYSRKPQ
jgi:hypothetical protein